MEEREEVLACRFCLITDVKLYNIDKYQLREAIESLIGSEICQEDSLPKFVCSVCGILLMKFSAFRNRCLSSQEILRCSLVQEFVITTDYVRTVIGHIPPLYAKRSYIEHFDCIDTSVIKEEPIISEDNHQELHDELLHEQGLNQVLRHEQRLDKKLRHGQRLDKKLRHEQRLDKKLRHEQRLDKKSRHEQRLDKKLKHGQRLDKKLRHEQRLDKKLRHEQRLDKKLHDQVLTDEQGIGQVLSVELEPLDMEDNMQEKYFDLKEEDYSEVEYEQGTNDGIAADDSEDEALIKTKEAITAIKSESCNLDPYIVCVRLTKEQQLKEVAKRAETSGYINAKYKCELCCKGFINSVTYRGHMMRHSELAGKFECEICHIRWKTNGKIRGHIRTAHEWSYACTKCNYVAKSSDNAKRHVKWHNGFTYKCEKCNLSFEKSTSYLSHMRLKHPTKFFCDICNESFLGQRGLAMHNTRAHQDANLFRDMSCREFVCALCGADFNNTEALVKHTEMAEGDQCDTALRPCRVCGAGFSSEKTLKKHMWAHQSDEIQCTKCDVKVKVGGYAAHYRKHYSGKLKRKITQNGDKYVCELCGKNSTNLFTLTQHQRTHTGEKPFQCNSCPKSFGAQQRLQIHQRIHTGDRPYKCTECPKAFHHKAGLNRHVRVHTGAKPYTCQYCSKSFSQSNSMKGHIRTVHLRLPDPYKRKRKHRPDDSKETQQDWSVESTRHETMS